MIIFKEFAFLFLGGAFFFSVISIGVFSSSSSSSLLNSLILATKKTQSSRATPSCEGAFSISSLFSLVLLLLLLLLFFALGGVSSKFCWYFQFARARIGAFGFEFAARFELESRENWTVTNVSVFGGGQNVARAR